MQWTSEDDKVAVVLLIILVLTLLLIRACISPEWQHPQERPTAPPESFYK